MLSDKTVVAMIPCVDFERARQFYEGKLGLSPEQESSGGATYTCKGGSVFALYPSSFAGTAQNTAMSWSVDDIAAELAELRARGVIFEEYNLPESKTVNGVAEFPGGRAAWFKDTEGNILGLTQFDR
jgi:predicted enzyme related to lactoylglutathione lyase